MKNKKDEKQLEQLLEGYSKRTVELGKKYFTVKKGVLEGKLVAFRPMVTDLAKPTLLEWIDMQGNKTQAIKIAIEDFIIKNGLFDLSKEYPQHRDNGELLELAAKNNRRNNKLNITEQPAQYLSENKPYVPTTVSEQYAASIQKELSTAEISVANEEPTTHAVEHSTIKTEEPLVSVTVAKVPESAEEKVISQELQETDENNDKPETNKETVAQAESLSNDTETDTNQGTISNAEEEAESNEEDSKLASSWSF